MLKKLALIGALSLAAAGSAIAQGYPTKPVTLVIPFSAGGGTDIVGRLIAQQLSIAWKQSVIVDNRPGANTLIGTEYVSRAPADGYTLLMASPSHTINASLYKKTIRFDTQKDFSGAALVATGPLVLVVNPAVPAKNVKELIALAKAKPGTINYASAGTGSSPHLAGELFTNLAHVQMTHVPYKGTAPATTDLIGGQVQAAFSPLPGVLQYIKTGKLRALGMTSSKRFAEMPEVPTIAESGVPGYEVEQWWGIVAPSGTPKDVLKKINDDVKKALESKAVRDQLTQFGAEAGHGTPDQLDTLIRNEIVQWGKLIDSAKITAD
jgi:tripartite-type tricarboxylate transporter receptor subunit TctC